jgi:hypothetical protein
VDKSILPGVRAVLHQDKELECKLFYRRGSGDHWLSALTVCPPNRVADSSEAPGKRSVTGFETIGSAFKAVTVEFAVVPVQSLRHRCSVLETGVPVLIAGVDGFSAAGARHNAGQRRAARVPAARNGYTRVAGPARIFGSGRLGRWVSVVDSRAAAAGSRGPAVDALRWRPLRICSLLGASAHNVMARTDDQNAIAQAYLELDGGLHVHYSER